MSDLLASLRRHHQLVLLLVSGLLVPLITDLAASWLQEALGQTPARLIQLLAFVTALAVMLWVLSLALQTRPEAVTLVPRDARPPRYPALITLVSKGDPENLAQLAAVKAIEYHRGDDGPLKVCWLIASSGVTGSVTVAEAIRKFYQDRCRVIVRQVGDPFAVQDTYDAVQHIYNDELLTDEFKDLALTPRQVIADFTGGTGPMSVGMALACGRYRPMQYMTGKYPDIASVPLLVQFKPTRRRRHPA